MKVKITDFVNQSQFTMNHIPVHIVLFIDKRLLKLTMFDQLLQQTCARTFHMEVRQMNKTAFGEFCSPRNNLLNIILGLLELFSSTGTNAKARKQC